jgi:hypothetical protein
MNEESVQFSSFVSAFGWSLAASAAGIALIGATYVLVGWLAQAVEERRRARPGRNPRERTELFALPRVDRRGLRRAVGIAVALAVVLAAAPWLDRRVRDVTEPWRDVPARDEPLELLGLAAVVWLGLVPLALFLWLLPRRTVSERAQPIAAVRVRQMPAVAGAAGRERSQLAEHPPYTRAVRSACGREGINEALGLPDFDRSWSAGSARLPFLGLVLAPAYGAALLAATRERGLVALAALLPIFWAGLAYERGRSRAEGRAASVVADYLQLMAWPVLAERHDALLLAERHLAPGPAAAQDHERLAATLTGIRSIFGLPWERGSTGSESEVVTVVLPPAAERERALQAAFHVRRSAKSGWQIARVVTEDADPAARAGEGPRVAIAAAWRPA